jgi:hypothetical protein
MIMNVTGVCCGATFLVLATHVCNMIHGLKEQANALGLGAARVATNPVTLAATILMFYLRSTYHRITVFSCNSILNV